MRYKIVVTVPTENAEAVRAAIGGAGGGRLGNYSFCSFSVSGVGRFRPEAGAQPHIGAVGRLEAVAEERIEVTCEGDVVSAVIAAIKAAHPYEEVALDVYRLEDWGAVGRSTSPTKRRERDHPPQSGWWRGKATGD